MALLPIVRYMLPYDDWRVDDENDRRVTIIGLMSNIRATDDPPYPFLHRELCVFLTLTEGRGQGTGRIACVFEETGQTVFETPERPIPFPPDPLAVVGVPFRIQDCTFPRPGLYSLQFWYNGVLVEERPLRLR